MDQFLSKLGGIFLICLAVGAAIVILAVPVSFLIDKLQKKKFLREHSDYATLTLLKKSGEWYYEIFIYSVNGKRPSYIDGNWRVLLKPGENVVYADYMYGRNLSMKDHPHLSDDNLLNKGQSTDYMRFMAWLRPHAKTGFRLCFEAKAGGDYILKPDENRHAFFVVPPDSDQQIWRFE